MQISFSLNMEVVKCISEIDVKSLVTTSKMTFPEFCARLDLVLSRRIRRHLDTIIDLEQSPSSSSTTTTTSSETHPILDSSIFDAIVATNNDSFCIAKQSMLKLCINLKYCEYEKFYERNIVKISSTQKSALTKLTELMYSLILKYQQHNVEQHQIYETYHKIQLDFYKLTMKQTLATDRQQQLNEDKRRNAKNIEIAEACANILNKLTCLTEECTRR